MNTYYLVRHGQTVWNTLGQTQGHGNSPLTELGIQQAKDLAEALKEYPIDIIYCSDLGRAVETAEIIGKELNIEIHPTESLREMGFGVWEGMPLREIEKIYPESFKMWRNEPEKVQIEGGETLDMIKQRQDKLIEELNEKYKNKHILLVSHSVTVRVMLLSFLESHVRNIYRIKQDNTALNIVEYRNYGPVIMKMNDTRHLKKDKTKGVNKSMSALE
ncbi:histidine phosphatase family protein [Peptostreptococcus russellii]|uniref:Probable phosphoglycerate mutase n=1 Tax=Peptostreptococcus russellii TaxID=215200 RepID=A0A1H8IJE7_9FIRM|nr:histidine phosphatase family protein [Peptostreptococcus russellii]MBC2577359.1 histidine phosphatase family protein [Peptostreptococcus russellii]SEN68369.1 probable phosphoglycerate mutase [Peptostreptococcus russellii]